MRIIAGTYRSLKLKTLSGETTRPTQDKIKEAIFSSVGPYFDGGRMLDLFAGSGSVGLEGVSRGIEQVYFCDMNKDAIRVIKDNIQHLKVEKHCIIQQMNYREMLDYVKAETFGLIFIDPPYALEAYDDILEKIEEYQMLDPFGVVVVESLKERSLLERYGSLVRTKEKMYGITKITYYRKEQ